MTIHHLPRARHNGLDAQGRFEDTQPEAGHAATEVGHTDIPQRIVKADAQWAIVAVLIVMACPFVAHLLANVVGVTR